MSNENAPLRTPEEWDSILNKYTEIYDPDGWRGPNGRDWNDLITKEEFQYRRLICTIGPRRTRRTP